MSRSPRKRKQDSELWQYADQAVRLDIGGANEHSSIWIGATELCRSLSQSFVLEKRLIELDTFADFFPNGL